MGREVVTVVGGKLFIITNLVIVCNLLVGDIVRKILNLYNVDLFFVRMTKSSSIQF